MATETPSVLEVMNAVGKEIGAISKSRKNQAQGFQFRGIDDVLNALHEPMHKHGLVLTFEVLERIGETRETSKGGSMNIVHLCVRYLFHGPAGDHISTTVWGEAQDSGDKATNKALSAAMKYAILHSFCIPTEDMEDADASAEPAQPRPQAPRAAPVQPQAQQAPTPAPARPQLTPMQKQQADRMIAYLRGLAVPEADIKAAVALVTNGKRAHELADRDITAAAANLENKYKTAEQIARVLHPQAPEGELFPDDAPVDDGAVAF